jgi:anti-sigma factor RsiW
MKISRNVIIDLLPLYLSDEASDETNALVREYLETDPELAEMAKEVFDVKLPEDAPVPLTWEDKMKAYKDAKRYMFMRTIFLAAIISFSVLAVLALGLIAAAYFIG